MLTRALVLALTVSGVASRETAAQYFGRQKVQYENFDWNRMDTPHFQIHYYSPELAVTKDAARMAARWYDRLSAAFQHEFETKPLILYADHPDFQQSNVVSDALDESTGGVTEGLRTRVIMPFTGVYSDNDHVLGHEIVHVFQYDLAASRGGGGLAGLSRLPLWLVEGMAEYLSLGRTDAHTAMWLRDAALRGELPTIDQLTHDTRFFPYRYGQALWAYVAGKYGDRAVTEIFLIATKSGFEEALTRVLGVGSKQLSEDWIAAIRALYLPLLTGRQRPEDAGRRVVYDADAGAMNLAPAVSPDGRLLAYIGRRDLFTPDLILADAQTGRTLRTLSSPQRNQHMDAISYVESAGSWSPDGRKFAFVVIRGGDSRIEILDVAAGKVERHIDLKDVGAVSDPRWAPDGRQIVFSGMTGGQSDLFILHLGSGDVSALTNDRYADVQPVWSPDGNRIAFVTDRAGTDFERLAYGEMQLALLDIATRQIRMVALEPSAKHIDPQFSPDGRSLYFVSDREGFSDIYRFDLHTQQLFQVTRLATGVSGITAKSAAISVAAGTGALFFSVFENSGNNIYAIECASACGVPVATAVANDSDVVASAGTAALLPPADALSRGLVAEYLADPMRGLPAQQEYPTSRYAAKIGLDYLGPPSFGVGTSAYGTLFAGGISAFFGDMLGNHTIGAAIQANGTLKDIGGQAMYRNSANRLNWGVAAGHIPYLTGSTSYAPAGNNTYQVTQYIDRIYVDQAMGLAYWPLSTTRRIEFNAGATRYSFDRELQQALYNGVGQPITNVEITQTEAPAAMAFFESAAAYVEDNSYFAFVGPVSGRRMRFEIAPTLGTLRYQTLLADYRQYSFHKPFTLAFRAMHYGRYGRNANGISDDNVQVLSPLFLGYESLVRGYAYKSFEANECESADPLVSACPAFDRLVGTRLAVANLELRIPLIGVPEFGLLKFPFLPTEIAPFVDAGLAWSETDSPVLSFQRNTLDRVPVFSAGVSARINILGFMVLETYWAYPFQRPVKGGHFGFNLSPAW
jgi:Tol biopolymer transport system component